MHLAVNHLEEIFPLAAFLSDVLGSSAEIVVHDINDLTSSIIFIHNGALSGRKVGDGTTDQALRMIKTGSANDCDFVTNYRGKSLNGHIFRSSTYFVKNRQERLVGLLCININTTGLDDVIEMLNSLRGLEWGGGLLPATITEENLQGDSFQTIRRIVHKAIDQSGFTVDLLTKDVRIAIIRKLQKEGVFLIKGAVTVVAPELNISIPTLYRYLQIIKV